ncbi:hypothetical protein WICMUC_004682 [Wickerhamomyces mucosus]|uniref:DUF2428 domain-containing protein n=1 Tax=Wickerhamomyces mucosus TaxID=1378264 RepID=A0A9P8PGU9_9ASCO|nr:hypothetical protein WICMUC_004682 [Wickerhamomyces mucosus]
MTNVEKISLDSIPFDINSILSIEDISSIRSVLISNKKVEQPNYDKFLTKIFPILINSLKTATGVGNLRVICSDTISIWVLRSHQLSLKNQPFKNRLQEILTIESLDFLYGYVIDYWNETGAPLSNSLKDLFGKLVSLVKLYPICQQIFKAWIDKALEIPTERRVLYYLIETLSKEIDDSTYIINKNPNFVENSLKFISTNALGNAIGRALTSIYQKLYIDEDHAKEWVDNYWSPIKNSLHSSDLKKGIQSNLLPNLFKISKVAFKLLIKDFENDLEFYIHCLNIGQQLFIEEDPYPQIVSRETIENLLYHQDYKVEIFRLLTYSPKGSKPIHKDIFEIVQQSLFQFFDDVEVETRNKFLSLFKQFLYRIKDSAYALDRNAKRWLNKGFKEQSIPLFEQVSYCKDFLYWLLSFVKTQLRPGSQYSKIISALTILKQLVESNLDPDILHKVEIDYPFEISIFDNELIRLLFDNVLNTYDDIRNYASDLLIATKFELSQQDKQKIIEKGFKMLKDYSSNDSGAKLLELSYKLFNNDISIFNRLVDTIPLNDNIFEAVNLPVDGYFNALQLIIRHFETFETPEKIVQIVERNWNNVKDILSHDSPEGCDQYGVGSAQLVLSYGWRSTKESTLLINELLKFDLSDDQLLQIGELTLDQLSTVRHRGAFSSVYPTFITLANVTKSRIPGQNQKWLDFNISLIQTKTQLITRRSGGLPFLITAIVTVERGLLDHAFNLLLAIAKTPVNEKDDSEKMDIPQVHAFNCMKNLFIESQLSQSCAPFIYRALELSLSTFSSKIWSVRNCSIMLFTALQNRLFARKKISARVFFSRFKGIKEILINILKTSIVDGNLEPLFPVLTVLSKLEATPGYDGLEDFKPLIRKCLETKYWKIRESASRALPSLITDTEQESKVLISSSSLKDQNALHGYLLALKALGTFSAEIADLFYSRIGDLLVENPSFSTRKVYLEIISDLFGIYGKHAQVVEILISLFLKDNTTYKIDGSKQLYLKELFKLVSDEPEILTIGLQSEFYEVKIEAINYCSENNVRDQDSLLQKIANDDKEWVFTRSNAIPLIDKYSTQSVFEFATNQKKYGEDIKRSALELLGSVVSKDISGDNFKLYTELLKSNSQEDEPFPVRYSALKSALRYVSHKKNPEIIWKIYEFLSDDDDEVRDLAAKYFDDGLTACSVANKFTKSFGSIAKEIDVLFSQILQFNPSFDYSVNESNILFIIEKGNFYRNNIEQQVNLSNMIKKNYNGFSERQKEDLKQHLKEVNHKLASFLGKIDIDGILGWSTNEIIFAEVYSTLYHSQSLGLDFSEIKMISKDLELHETLNAFLA